MKAVVYDAVGAPPRLGDWPEPACPVDGAVVEVRASGVCRSDWHAWRGHEPVPLPHVPGHEFAGVVSAVGPQVRGFAAGDHVTAPFVHGCGRCDWCRSGQAQVCPDQTQPGFTGPGSFAEQVVVRAADLNLVRLPVGLPYVPAAALGCRFATAFRAITAHGRLERGEWLAVFGCGGVGLSAVLIAASLGARVVAVDVVPAAAARAVELGAAVTVTAEDPVSGVLEATGGGAHVSLDALGSTATVAASVAALRRRGRHVQAGLMTGPDARAGLPWDLVIGRELQLYGSHGMAAADYPPMLDLVASGRLEPQRLVGRVIGLDEAPDALVALGRPATDPGITVIAASDQPEDGTIEP